MVHVTNLGDLLSVIIDGYDDANRDQTVVLNALNEGVGQAFTSPLRRVRLTDAVFQLYRNAAFNGTVRARLYRATGTVGTDATPDIAGGVLATSDPITQADIDIAWGLVNFHFPTPYTLDPEQDYVIVLVMTVYVAGGVGVGIDGSSPTHAGNETDNTTGVWVGNAGQDTIFYLFSFVLGTGEVDVIDRAARLLGIVYGALGQLQQKAGTLELLVEDTGVNTNPEKWLQDNHWDADEVTINANGVAGEQNLGGAVPAGMTRRIKEITIRHAGTNPTVVTLLISGGATKLSVPVPAAVAGEHGRAVWSSKDGRKFTVGQQPAVQSSDVANGNTYVSASGVEA